MPNKIKPTRPAPYAAGAVVETIVSLLALSQDVPQFKSDSGANGVTQGAKLDGRYSRALASPIQVWARADGRMEVISGRHRLDLAQRSGEATIPAQIHLEIDGFTANSARMLDIELNVKDGRGKVRDYVTYFKEFKFTAERARADGLLNTAIGRNAHAIAQHGTTTLHAAHANGALGDEAAVSIAQNAPGNEALQNLGMQQVASGKTINHAVNVMRAARAAGFTGGNSGDMFGFDDSFAKEAEAVAKEACKQQGAIRQQLAAIRGASKRPELAAKGGVEVKDLGATNALICAMEVQLSELEGFSTNPDVYRRLRVAAGLACEDQPAPDFLTAPSQQEILDQQERIESAGKASRAQQRAADELARRDRERLDIMKASEWAADTFMLGGDAEQNLSGQGSMFDAPDGAIDAYIEALAAADVAQVVAMAQAAAVIEQAQAPAIEVQELATVCEGEASEGQTVGTASHGAPVNAPDASPAAPLAPVFTVRYFDADEREESRDSHYAAVAADHAAAMQTAYENRRITTYARINQNDCFQFGKSWTVFVKCADGYRPGRGGALAICQDDAAVWFYDPAMLQASEPAAPANAPASQPAGADQAKTPSGEVSQPAALAEPSADQVAAPELVGGGEGRPSKNEIVPTVSPVNYLGDIPASLALSAYSGTSFSPERRGTSARNKYSQSMSSDLEEMRAQAVKGGTLELLPEVFARYRSRQASAYRAYLASSSRIVSSFIAGPSNFPAARMNKRADIAHKRLTEYLDGGEMAKRAAVRTLRPDLRAIMAGDADAVDRLTVELESAERRQNQMKAANKAIRANAKMGEAHQVAALMEIGYNEVQAVKMLHPMRPYCQGFESFTLTNNQANIRRMKARLEQITAAKARPVVAIECASGITLEDDAPANRVRLFFPGKPSAEIRTTLKSGGFRWAPSLGAWQAYRNNSTLQIAQEIAGKPAEAEPMEIIEPAAIEAPAAAQAIEAPAEILAPIACEIPAIEPAKLPEIIESVRNDGLPHRCPSGNKQKAAGKSGAWTAELYKNAAGAFVLQFMGLLCGLSWTFYSTAGERVRALQVMGLQADQTPPAPAGNFAQADAPAETSASPAPVEPVTDTGVGGAARSILESAPAFERVQPFSLDPRALLTEGVTAAQLIGLGVNYTGNMADLSGRGAITAVADNRSEKWGTLRIVCTLEDGRVIDAEPHYFTASLRPILQFNSQHHGAPYLAELAMAAMLKRSSESSAAELASQAHAKALAALPLEFPDLILQSSDPSRGGVFAAKNIRIMLKKAFKGVKFSVTADYSAVRVGWTDGPTDAQVAAITRRFSGGSFDGMADSYEYSKSAFTDLFGSSQYIFAGRKVSDGLIQAAIDQHYQDQDEKPTVSDYQKNTGPFSQGNDSDRRYFSKMLNSMTTTR